MLPLLWRSLLYVMVMTLLLVRTLPISLQHSYSHIFLMVDGVDYAFCFLKLRYLFFLRCINFFVILYYWDYRSKKSYSILLGSCAIAFGWITLASPSFLVADFHLVVFWDTLLVHNIWLRYIAKCSSYHGNIDFMPPLLLHFPHYFLYVTTSWAFIFWLNRCHLSSLFFFTANFNYFISPLKLVNLFNLFLLLAYILSLWLFFFQLCCYGALVSFLINLMIALQSHVLSKFD